MDRTGATTPLRGRKILIVEDEVLIALQLENLIRELGCTVVGPVHDVGWALSLLDKEPPDAALVDLNLKGTPATPLASALSARRVPFLLVTGYASTQSDDPALDGAPRLAKPVDPGALERALSALLGSP